MSSVASTVTSGIQEISALLPLLGTEQCEEHTGSALGKGYFYTCITPISIFGSLGIVKAGFNVLVAAIIVPSWKFLGAKRLADGGFRPRGDIAQLIALDPQHPGRFLAESNLEKILEDMHIDNVEDLKIEWAPGSTRWNIRMAFYSLVVSSIGITPYLFIILRTKDPLFLSGWGFPIARLIGSSLAGIIIQFIVQIRILSIIRNRLIFLTMDRYIKAPYAQNLLDQQHINELRTRLHGWDANQTSEMCLWDLHMFLRNHVNAAPIVPPTPTLAPGINESSSGDAKISFSDSSHDAKTPYNFHPLQDYLKSTRRRHFPRLRGLPLTLAGILNSWIYISLHVFLGIALLLSVAGYIGSFNLIQNATQNDVGPILWLVLEVCLCLLRIVVWAWNPTSDDNKGVAFRISLASKSPLVTCNIYGDELESIEEAPVVRSQTFLKDIASYTGPLPAFRWSDAALYYILTGSSYSGTAPAAKALYIVVSAFKEQTSRLIVKRDPQKDFSFFVSELKANAHNTNITISTQQTSNIEQKFGRTERETHVLTSDPEFMKQLSDHYDAILHRINVVDHNPYQIFYLTWALQINSKLNPIKYPTQPVLTPADVEYLNEGRLETCRDTYAKRLEIWVDKYMEAFEKDLLEQVPYSSHNPMTKHEGIEINEVEYLIAEARRHMEQLLLDTFNSWRQLIIMNHVAMVDNVIAFFASPAERSPNALQRLLLNAFDWWRQPITNLMVYFFDPPSEPPSKSIPGLNPIEKIRIRLQLERHSVLERFSTHDYKRMARRIDAYSDSVRARINKRRYLDPKEGDRIIDQWRKRLELNAAWKGYRDASGDPGGSLPEATPSIPESTSSQTTVYHLAEKYDEVMYKRLQSKERFLRSIEGKELRDRCQSRFDQWKSRLQINAEEFQMIATPEFLPRVSLPSREIDFARKYWSISAMSQRLSLMDHHIKYVIVSNKLLDDLGGFVNFALALKQSQASILYFKCSFHIPVDEGANGSPIQKLGENGVKSDLSYGGPEVDDDVLNDYESDVAGSTDPLDSKITDFKGSYPLLKATMRAIVNSTPSITGVHFSNKMYHLSDSIQAVLDKNNSKILSKAGTQMICEYENIDITDYFRRNRPYILFGHSRHAKCTVKFCVEEKVDHTLTLTHAFTALDAEIDIKLNGQSLAKTKGKHYRTINEFYDEHITIPLNRLHIRPAQNLLTIKLVDRNSEPDEYFLSDVVLQKSILKRPEGPIYTGSLSTEPEDIFQEAIHQNSSYIKK